MFIFYRFFKDRFFRL